MKRKKDKITKVNYLIDSEEIIVGVEIECPYCQTKVHDKVIKQYAIQTQIVECMRCGERLEYII